MDRWPTAVQIPTAKIGQSGADRTLDPNVKISKADSHSLTTYHPNALGVVDPTSSGAVVAYSSRTPAGAPSQIPGTNNNRPPRPPLPQAGGSTFKGGGVYRLSLEDPQSVGFKGGKVYSVEEALKSVEDVSPAGMRAGQYGMGRSTGFGGQKSSFRNMGMPGASPSFHGASSAQVTLNSYGSMGMGMRGTPGMGRERLMDSFGGGMDVGGGMAGGMAGSYGTSAMDMELAIAARARALAANEMILRRQMAMRNAMAAEIGGGGGRWMGDQAGMDPMMLGGGPGGGGGVGYGFGGAGVPRRTMMDGGGMGLGKYGGVCNRSFGNGMGSSRFAGGYGNMGMQNEIPGGMMGGIEDMYVMKQALMMEAMGAGVEGSPLSQFDMPNGASFGTDAEMWNMGAAFRRAVSDPELDRPRPRMYAGDLLNPSSAQITMRDLGVTGPNSIMSHTTASLIPSVLMEAESSPAVSQELSAYANTSMMTESHGRNMSLDPGQSFHSPGARDVKQQSGSPPAQTISTIGSEYSNTTSGQTRRWPVSTYSLSRNTKKMLANAGANAYLGSAYQQRGREQQYAQLPFQSNGVGVRRHPNPLQQEMQQRHARPQPPALQQMVQQNGNGSVEGAGVKRVASATMSERNEEPNKRPRLEHATSPPTRKGISTAGSSVRGSPTTRFLEEAIGGCSRLNATEAEGNSQTKVQRRPNLMIQTQVERECNRTGPPSTPVSQRLSSAVTACETPFSATPPNVPVSLQHRLGPRAKYARPTALELCAAGPSPSTQTAKVVFDSAVGATASCGRTRSPAEEVLMSPVAIVAGSGAEATAKEEVACCPAAGVAAGEWLPAHVVDCGGKKERVLFSACHVSLEELRAGLPRYQGA
ncbi:hypothetical protein BJ742DRAFT_774044 [Cladochytrium replicatum]|nr:hypothetical protein BJ742DRAFT_774044 [Cladochytrium replicatum]